MRAYFFGNMYLSSIQQGIQSAHTIAEMSVKYYCAMDGGDETGSLFYEWASYHKTMILLNGGYSENLHELVSFFDSDSNPYPWAYFHEGRDALDGALTDVGIVLPEKIYETARLFRQFRTNYGDKLCPKSIVKKYGTLVIEPNNEWGIECDSTFEWTFNQWEVALCEKLNEFGLAR